MFHVLLGSFSHTGSSPVQVLCGGKLEYYYVLHLLEYYLNINRKLEYYYVLRACIVNVTCKCAARATRRARPRVRSSYLNACVF